MAALLLMWSGCGGPTLPVFLSPEGETVPRATDVLVSVSAEGSPSGSDLVLYVGSVRVAGEPGSNSVQYVWDTTAVDEAVTLWAKVTSPSGKSAEASRTVTVSDAAIDPPAVEFLWPLDGQTLEGEILIQVEPTGTNASLVESVRIDLDGTLLVEDTQADFFYTWDATEMEEGLHTLSATGRYGDSYTAAAEISVFLGSGKGSGPISVIITAPAEGETISGAYICTAAVEHDFDIAFVDFAVDGVTQHSSTVDPWQWVWNTQETGEGEHVLMVTATDVSGNAATDEVTVSIPPAGTLEVTLDAPTEGEIIHDDYQVKATVIAAADVQILEFLLDGVVMKSMTNAPWQWAWPVLNDLESGALLAGEHQVSVQVTDVEGHFISASAVVQVQDGG